MSAASPKTKPLPTIWNVPDDLWEVFANLIQTYDPPKKTGRKRIDPRKALDGIIFRMRTGCQWNQLPPQFGDDASVHRTFQRWDALGLFDKLWATLLTQCQELDGVDWHWQAADGCLSKARGVPKRGPSKKPAAKIPQIVLARASRKACLSRETADRSPSRLAGPTFRTRTCSP
jgi:transposase